MSEGHGVHAGCGELGSGRFGESIARGVTDLYRNGRDRLFGIHQRRLRRNRHRHELDVVTAFAAEGARFFTVMIMLGVGFDGLSFNAGCLLWGGLRLWNVEELAQRQDGADNQHRYVPELLHVRKLIMGGTNFTIFCKCKGPTGPFCVVLFGRAF